MEDGVVSVDHEHFIFPVDQHHVPAGEDETRMTRGCTLRIHCELIASSEAPLFTHTRMIICSLIGFIYLKGHKYVFHSSQPIGLVYIIYYYDPWVFLLKVHSCRADNNYL